MDVLGSFLSIRLVAKIAFKGSDIHVETHMLLHCLLIRISLEAYETLSSLYPVVNALPWYPLGELFDKILA